MLLCCLSVVIVLCCYLCCSVIIVLFYVLIVCTVTLPPGVNPIAVDKYIYLTPRINVSLTFRNMIDFLTGGLVNYEKEGRAFSVDS